MYYSLLSNNWNSTFEQKLPNCNKAHGQFTVTNNVRHRTNLSQYWLYSDKNT